MATDTAADHTLCIHDMVIEWCGICRGLKTPEEEEKEQDKNFDDWLDKL